ncbi:MAG: hypothetical protein LQ349_004804 [Xanthoria aureola]|nr:MAG: hypothetical protein LQ349_004804 [Xanthoria aureola]
MNRPIHYACMEGKPEIVQLLLGYSADAEVESSGRRPLHYAAAQGLTAIATVLLARGVDIEARDATGDRALGIASKMGHIEIVRMLLDRGSRLRSKFAKGPSHEDSPLCLAAKGGHVAVVEELLSRGTSVLQRDEQNWSPLRHASYYAHPQVVELLLRAGATISSHTSGGWGFDITARRIGFASEVLGEEPRKALVLNLLIEAEAKEAKEAKAQEDTSRRFEMLPARRIGEKPVELASGSGEYPDEDSDESTATDHAVRRTNDSTTITTSQKPHPPPSELDTATKSTRSPPKTPYDPNTIYPSPSHVANAFGYDAYPQQHRYSAAVSEPDDSRASASASSWRPISTESSSNPTSTSVVQIGSDGLWRLRATGSSSTATGVDGGVGGGASIYEMGS